MDMAVYSIFDPAGSSERRLEVLNQWKVYVSEIRYQLYVTAASMGGLNWT